MVLGKLTKLNPVPLSLGHPTLACKFYFVRGEIKLEKELSHKCKIFQECMFRVLQIWEGKQIV